MYNINNIVELGSFIFYSCQIRAKQTWYTSFWCW